MTVMAREAMSNSEVLGMIGYLLFYASVAAGVIVGVCCVIKHVSAKIEARYTEHDQSPVVDRCNVYTLRPGEHEPVPRQRPSLFSVRRADRDDRPAA